MDNKIRDIANRYRSKRPSTQTITGGMDGLYQHYIKKREQAIIEAAATATAIHALFLADQIDWSKVTPQMEEAFNLAYPEVELSSLADRSSEEIEGFLSAWKGKYFEVLVRDELNAGEWVGEIRLEPGQTAILAEDATQPGWDLQIVNSDGSIAQELQLKATESVYYVKEALERYPDIDVLATDEVLRPGGEIAQNLFSSGFSDESLEKTIRAPMEDLLDGPLEDFFQTIIPGLPFALIAVGEGRKVLIGKKSFEIALQDGLSRAVKSGAAIGIGTLVFFLDGGVFSIPASLVTRMGIDRYQIMGKSIQVLDKRIGLLQGIRA